MRTSRDVEVANVEMQMFSLRGGADQHDHAPLVRAVRILSTSRSFNRLWSGCVGVALSACSWATCDAGLGSWMAMGSKIGCCQTGGPSCSSARRAMTSATGCLHPLIINGCTHPVADAISQHAEEQQGPSDRIQGKNELCRKSSENRTSGAAPTLASGGRACEL